MMLVVTDLCKSYGKLQVLKSVNMQCKAGDICGVLGANGAGKTTLFKIILGLVKPDSGRVNLKAQGIKPIGGIVEKPALYDYLNAYDNLNLFCKSQGLKPTATDIYNRLQQVGLPIDRTDPVRNYSMGMKQRLGIAIALLNNPKSLILDEPFSGLDPLGISALRKLIIDLAEKQHLAILISSHIIDELSKICNTLYVIKEGEIIKSGSAQDIILENTTSFSFSAPNIKLSEALKCYDVKFKGEIAQVSVSTNQVPKLIQELSEEKIFITSCVPELDMDKLFQYP
ncbi:ABC transporter ATP-binding protein [Formosa undariae]|uniref:ABC transporter ATP-binding protein n=1 Tax=Formosa undariae TaxID=1325436 RepID=A0ABV5EZJ6_9FLAO